jgi:FAD/FMN-containing dehydrogenase/Fe-S oxidoreductase
VADGAVAALLSRLKRDLDGEVASDDYTRHLFSRDASMYSIMPACVAFPRHAGDVAAAVTAAAEHGVPVTARGAGTSLAGQTTGPGLVLDLSRHLNRIISLDPEARTAVVEPGVVQDQLNRAASEHGLMFGPDTSTSNRATLGGMIGNNSAGSGSIRYGMTIDHVAELDVVLSDGSAAHFGGPLTEAEWQRHSAKPGLEGGIYRELSALTAATEKAIAGRRSDFWRRAGGYRLDRLHTSPRDLAKFVTGSEGTLVAVTRAVVGLVPRPRHTVIAVGHFASTPAAIAATGDALACDPSAVELMDRMILDLSRRKIEYSSLGTILHGDPEALLFVSFAGDSADEVRAQLARLVSLWREHGHGYHTLEATTPEQQGPLLKVRKAGLGLLMAASTGTRRPLAFVEDTAVDPVHLPDYTRRFKDVLDRHGLKAGFYGHCSVGCLHIRPFVDLTRPDEVAAMRAVAGEIKDLVREYGGVNSSEHGDGLARSEFNRELFGDELYEAMRRVKRAFDPKGILNPGKIVDSPAMTDNLRDPALPPAPALRTRLSFSVTGASGASGAGGDGASGGDGGGGMRAAADRCMNIGLCRKTDAGVMCPSYMATRKEEDSTRGRANALVKALSSPDPHTALSDERLHEVLDLCLMCKACKSECPLGVDMAALKSEALSHYNDVHGVPPRSRVFGAIRTLNRLGSATAPVSNLPGRVPVVRALLDRVLGIASARPLPSFARQNLVRWFRGHTPFNTSQDRAAERPVASVSRETPERRPPATGPEPAPAVTFLADSFTTFTEPSIGQAAIELLERAGWQVRLESGGCCGRASLSKGLVDKAASDARRLVGLLRAPDPAGTGSPIVGCEPSCLMTLRDEYRSLLPGDPAAEDVAGRVRQVEELLGSAIDAGDLRLREDSWLAGKTLLYHGHCHQKAEVGTAATVALLRRIPGVTVRELDAGCCGMAGSFGYESEHYDVSMTVGRDRLFPAIEAAPDAVIVATGTSCRQQIFHGTERDAWHPVQLVREALLIR